ncbi:hypothetical protein QVD17_07370 [Tagetes erecta]|uniref:Uncharacterized protein n=1 Tax=Tagetes erecta TaxID=13708 RepID=A0AAD8LMH8_TARER|nr:hypothetical protein QVD17_07370 [Tagetes erecta]
MIPRSNPNASFQSAIYESASTNTEERLQYLLCCWASLRCKMAVFRATWIAVVARRLGSPVQRWEPQIGPNVDALLNLSLTPLFSLRSILKSLSINITHFSFFHFSSPTIVHFNLPIDS